MGLTLLSELVRYQPIGATEGIPAMMICHCNGISDADIHSAIDWMRASDGDTIITPGKVYRALGKRPDCGGCLPLFLATMERNANLEVPAGVPVLRTKTRETA